MQAILPTSLVPAAQAFITAQGGNPYMINTDGTLNPTGIVQEFFSDAELRTNLGPPVHFPISASGAPPDPVMAELLQRVQPTITLTGKAGSFTIAPYGNAAGGATSWLPLIAGGVVLLGVVGWLLFAD